MVEEIARGRRVDYVGHGVDRAARFVAGGASPNAVQVTLNTKVDLFFAVPFLRVPTLTISRTATAAQAQEASFSIGSGLLGVQGGVANSVLAFQTGARQIDLERRLGRVAQRARAGGEPAVEGAAEGRFGLVAHVGGARVSRADRCGAGCR